MAKRSKDFINTETVIGEDYARNGSPFYTSDVGDMPEDERLSDEIEHSPDGSITIALAVDDDILDTPELGFDANLASKLSDTERTTLGAQLKEFVDADIQSRQTWERRMLDGLEIIGLEDIPDDAVAFEGAARVNHPSIAEAMVQFQARTMDELMPAEGPVKCGVVGRITQRMEARARRVEEYMNYQLTEEDDEYYNDTDQMLLYLPYAGSAFRKVGIDPVLGRTRSRFIPAADFIVPYWAKSLQTAPRYTHRYTMPYNTFKRAVDAGYFVDEDFGSVTPDSGDSSQQTLADVSDDKAATYHSDDRDLRFFEMTVDRKFAWETFGKELKYDLPYTITFEEQTGKVVRIARCWQETDPKCTKNVWFTHYKFLPGLGFYGWGYLHIIGGLGRAASGALRLLLDGAATSSLQGGFKSRECRIAGDVQFSPGVWTDVDMSAEELAKSFYAPPFKEPSPALFKTLEILLSGIQRFASTTEQMVGDASNNGPVGTTVALIEQGSKIFSGIHKRLHASARREFKMIALCNYLYMEEDEYPYDVENSEGEDPRTILRDDFGPGVDIIPVSDPNIFSSVQRIALAQATVQLIDSAPDIYSKQAKIRAHKAMLLALKVPEADKLLPDKVVLRLDPVSENVAMLNGQPVQAFAEQDDEAHMAVHAMFEQEVMGLDPEIANRVLPVLKAHQAAHYASMYRKRIEASVMAATGVPLPMYDANNPEENEELPPDIEAMVARAAAQYAPPPPAPAPTQEQGDVQSAKDLEAARKADRDDMLAQREADRKDGLAKRDADRADAEKMAELQRDGIVPDFTPEAPPSPQMM